MFAFLFTRTATAHTNVWVLLSLQQPTFQTITTPQRLFRCTCSNVVSFKYDYEMWVVEIIVRPPYDKRKNPRAQDAAGGTISQNRLLGKDSRGEESNYSLS